VRGWDISSMTKSEIVGRKSLNKALSYRFYISPTCLGVNKLQAT